jgi:hypothetical protein
MDDQYVKKRLNIINYQRKGNQNHMISPHSSKKRLEVLVETFFAQGWWQYKLAQSLWKKIWKLLKN